MIHATTSAEALPTIGIDLGGTNMRSALVMPDGRLRNARREETPKDRDLIFPRLQEIIDDLRSEGPVAAVGVAVPGAVEDGIVTSNNLGWQRVRVADHLRMDGVPLVVENDMAAAAAGEHCFGAGKGCNNMILLTVSTGIGAGIIIGGKLQRGAHGVAGEVGHHVVNLNGLLCGCGRRGCWEMIASGTAHKRRVREAFRDGTWPNLVDEPSVPDVTRMAESGDKAAIALLKRTGRYLGIGLANLVNLYDPDVIVLTGGFARNTWNLLHEYMEAEMDEQALTASVNLAITQLGDDAGLLGAATLARKVECGS
jgi:glucokinase